MQNLFFIFSCSDLDLYFMYPCDFSSNMYFLRAHMIVRKFSTHVGFLVQGGVYGRTVSQSNSDQQAVRYSLVNPLFLFQEFSCLFLALKCSGEAATSLGWQFGGLEMYLNCLQSFIFLIFLMIMEIYNTKPRNILQKCQKIIQENYPLEMGEQNIYILLLVRNYSIRQFDLIIKMLVQGSVQLKASSKRRKTAPIPTVMDHCVHNRENKALTQRMSIIQASTKRLETLPSSRKSQERRSGSLLFSKNLFKNARKVDLKTRQSFLPHESQLATDNNTKIKLLLSAYSKLQGRGRESPSQKTSKIDKLRKSDHINPSTKKESVLQGKPLSSLTQLILNECNAFLCENGGELPKEIDSFFKEGLGEEQYSQWINLLCESSINVQPSGMQVIAEGDNPYELPLSREEAPKKSKKLEWNGHLQFA